MAEATDTAVALLVRLEVAAKVRRNMTSDLARQLVYGLAFFALAFVLVVALLAM